MTHPWTRDYPSQRPSHTPIAVRRRHPGRELGASANAVLATVALAAILWSGPAAGACFRYGDVVTLSGSHFNLVAAPVDGVIRAPQNDAARRADLLMLDAPFCVNADTLSGSVSGAATVQLNCPAIDVPDGSSVTLTGRLIGADTGNGHTPVILSCQT